MCFAISLSFITDKCDILYIQSIKYKRLFIFWKRRFLVSTRRCLQCRLVRSHLQRRPLLLELEVGWLSLSRRSTPRPPRSCDSSMLSRNNDPDMWNSESNWGAFVLVFLMISYIFVSYELELGVISESISCTLGSGAVHYILQLPLLIYCILVCNSRSLTFYFVFVLSFFFQRSNQRTFAEVLLKIICNLEFFPITEINIR